jgi:ABC-2 type transport system ATP-binding protein
MSTPLISIRNLKKSYGSGASTNEVLKGINLDIYPGQIIGYIGPNGAGKSTTVKILSGILSDFEGDIEVLGYNLRTQSLEIKKHIGYVPEVGAIYELLSPNEYLGFIGNLYEIEEETLKTRIGHLLTLFGMEKHADQRMDTFSKGMKQKILIISGIINNPDILFLDEPLSGLDANAVILVKELLVKLVSEGKTIFYSSHLMDVVEKISDRIILINNGNVVADGSFETLKTENAGTLEKLFAQLTGNESNSFNSEVLNKAFGEQ